MSEETKGSFDKFELAAAVLLGLGATAASIAGHQEGLWGGQSVEAYGEAAALTTKASTTYNDELTTYMQDVAADQRAKELSWEALESEDEALQTRQLSMASWIYTAQLSESAYKALGLPVEVREAYNEGSEDKPTELNAEQLEAALNIDLDQDYVDEVFGTSGDEFDAADKRFNEGRDANNHGDKFSLAGVILTVSLFFAGLALVFKSKIKWGFLGMGGVVFLSGLGYMLSLTWA